MKFIEKRMILGVSGGIAAYKTAELVSGLVQRGLAIDVIMTQAAQALVGSKTFQALTGRGVYTSLWEEDSSPLAHIQVTAQADLFAVIPATANIIAKYAAGIADDLLTTALLAYDGAVLIAPAMNLRMYKHPATQANLNVLRERGVEIVGPSEGRLACGDEGEGRLAPLAQIEFHILRLLERQKELADRLVLVTAGGTREKIDAVRFIGNPASGRMGYALARASALRGAKVVLVSANSSLPDPYGVEVVKVRSADDMASAVFERAQEAQVVIMAAAVGDYAPKETSSEKIKKGAGGLTLELSPTVDILAELGKRKREGQVLVGFAAESDQLEENARKKLVAKNLDLVCANPINEEGVGFASEDNLLTLIDPSGVTSRLPLMSKDEVAEQVIERIVEIISRGENISPDNLPSHERKDAGDG